MSVAHGIVESQIEPTVFYSLSANFIGGEGRGEVVLSFQKVGLFICRTDCLRVPLSLALSPRFAGRERE